MTEQDAREALRERLAEALRAEPECNCGGYVHSEEEHQIDALLPAVEEYAADAWDAGKKAMFHARVMQGGDDPQNPYRGEPR